MLVLNINFLSLILTIIFIFFIKKMLTFTFIPNQQINDYQNSKNLYLFIKKTFTIFKNLKNRVEIIISNIEAIS